jgi:ferritin-like protein
VYGLQWVTAGQDDLRDRTSEDETMAHEGLHEPAELLDEATIDRHRAFTSLIEELEAIDWYDQRVHATRNPELASVLAHNRDDEKEHAAMALEWIRRQDPAFDKQLRLYLFTTGPITSVEDSGGDAPASTSPGDLGMGGLRGES